MFPKPVVTPSLLWLGLLAPMLAAGEAPAQPELNVRQLATAAKTAAQTVAPAIVQIETLGGLEKVEGFLVGTAPTSGLVVDQRGYVISSAFNFKHAPTAILLTFADGRKLPAKIVARDTSRMLVLLKCESDQPLFVPESVSKDRISPGQWAIALGKTFDIRQPSISIGIVSATDRIWGRAIQTDAKTSPTNYGGPLVDVRGRVLGVIVPLSPDSNSEVAGADQYDGGIGFAIPMSDIQQMLSRMIEGQDIAPGLLGVTVKQQDLYAQESPQIAYCPPKSPAAQAGMKQGDRIVQINGVKLSSYADMKHALGPHNAGDTLRIVAMRGERRLERDVTLVDKVDPYLMPFLGLVAQRAVEMAVDNDKQPSERQSAQPLTVGFVYPESPAAKAGLRVGDRLLALLDKRPKSVAEWRYELALLQPGDTVHLTFARNGQQQAADVVLESVPDTVPSTFPPAVRLRGTVPDEQPVAGDDATIETGWIEIKLPTEPNTCFAWVPDNYVNSIPHGLLIVMGLPGEVDPEQTQPWRNFCAAENFILLVPESLDERAWQRSETGMIRKLTNRLMQSYTIDDHRIAAFGNQVGGAMAYRFTFENRDLVRGVATVDAVLPLGVQPRGNDPVERLEVYTLAFQDSKLFQRSKRTVDALREQLKFPVLSRWLEGDYRELDEEQLAELQRWLTSLDHM